MLVKLLFYLSASILKIDADRIEHHRPSVSLTSCRTNDENLKPSRTRRLFSKISNSIHSHLTLDDDRGVIFAIFAQSPKESILLSISPTTEISFPYRWMVERVSARFCVKRRRVGWKRVKVQLLYWHSFLVPLPPFPLPHIK